MATNWEEALGVKVDARATTKADLVASGALFDVTASFHKASQEGFTRAKMMGDAKLFISRAVWDEFVTWTKEDNDAARAAGLGFIDPSVATVNGDEASLERYKREGLYAEGNESAVEQGRLLAIFMGFDVSMLSILALLDSNLPSAYLSLLTSVNGMPIPLNFCSRKTGGRFAALEQPVDAMDEKAPFGMPVVRTPFRGEGGRFESTIEFPEERLSWA